jgi:putative effector of murein hydrolase
MLYFLASSIAPNCQYPVGVSIFVAVQNLIMFVMFFDFYRKAYRKEKNV